MVIANLAIRFIVELIGVGALAYSGYQAPFEGIGRIAVAILAPLALVAVWAVVVAPNADNALTQAQRDAIGTGLLVLVGVLLVAAGQPVAGAAFGAMVVLNWLLLMAFGQEVANVIRSLGGSEN